MTTAPLAPHKLHLLLVDDDVFILDIYTVALQNRGHIVVPCHSAIDALSQLRGGYIPDMIVTDLTMPDMDGFDLLATIRAEHLAEAVPIVVLSNQDDFVDFEKVKKYSVAAQYVKIRSTPSGTAALLEGVYAHEHSPDKHPLPSQ